MFLLLVIHTTDMELTNHYIGNDWARETFIPMRLCIKYIGIKQALWISRIVIYSLCFACLLYKDNKHWIYALILGTILYYAAMITWLFDLNIINWN